MTQLVGVKASWDIRPSSSIKREALMFSQVAIPYLAANDVRHDLRDEIAWLIDQGVVFRPVGHIDDGSQKETKDERLSDYYKFRDLKIDNIKALLSSLDLSDSNQLDSGAVITHHALNANSSDFQKLWQTALEYQIRQVSAELRAVNNINAYPVLSSDLCLNVEQAEADKADVIQIVLNSLPVPTDSSPWEQILDYRNDPASQGQFLALNNWMNEVACAKLAPIEIEEKLEWLLHDYQSHMNLHRLKTNSGTLETIVTSAAEILGDLITFKWGAAARALFSLRHRRLALMEAEMDSPGNEIAYILNTKQEVFDVKSM